MRQTKIRLFKLDFLLGVAIVLCQIMNLQSLTSLLFYASFFVSAALWLSTTAEAFDRVDFLALLIILVALVHVLINAVLCRANVSFQYMKKYIMFCCSVIFLADMRRIQLDKADIRLLERLYLVIGLFMLFMFVTRNTQMHLFNGQYTQYLTFRFTNPNTTALFLACMIMFLEIVGFQKEKGFFKTLLFLVALIELYFLYLTKSRNALLAIVVFTVVALYFLIKKRKIVLKNWILAFAAVLPMVFAVVYMKVINTEGFNRLFSFIVGEGKSLDSRVRIWSPAFRAFEASPIFGAYYQVSNGTGMSQLHNTHVDILASYGLSVLVMVCIFLYVLMREKPQNTDAATHDSALLGFICALLLGIGEAALFAGGLSIYMFFGVFLALANGEKGTKSDGATGLHQ